MRVLVIVALVGSCGIEQTFESGIDWVTEHGSVYECQATATDVLELCTDLDLEGLERATKWDCWPTTRLWPRVTGCIYSCEPHQGCNAHHGCFCPEP